MELTSPPLLYKAAVVNAGAYEAESSTQLSQESMVVQDADGTNFEIIMFCSFYVHSHFIKTWSDRRHLVKNMMHVLAPIVPKTLPNWFSNLSTDRYYFSTLVSVIVITTSIVPSTDTFDTG